MPRNIAKYHPCCNLFCDLGARAPFLFHLIPVPKKSALGELVRIQNHGHRPDPSFLQWTGWNRSSSGACFDSELDQFFEAELMLNPRKIHTGLLSVPRRREFLGILSTEWKDGCTQRVVDCSLFYLGKFQYTQAKRVSRSKRFIHSERPGQTFPASLLLHGYFNDSSKHRIPLQESTVGFHFCGQPHVNFDELCSYLASA